MSKETAQDLYGQALAHHKAGRLGEAERLYRAVLEGQPDEPQTLQMLSIIVYGDGKYEEAEGLVRRVLAVRGEAPLLHFSLGNILKAQGKLDGAVESYRATLKLKPDHADGLNNLALTLEELGNISEAEAAFRQAIALRPGEGNYSYNLGQLLKSAGRYEESIECYARSLAIEPSWQGCASIGYMLQKRGRFDEAKAMYQRGLTMAPDSFEILNNLGGICMIQARYHEALAYFKAALTLKPESAEALSNIAMALKDLGRLDETIEYCRKALAVAPQDANITSNVLLTMVYANVFSPQELADTARAFGAQIADGLLRERTFENERSADRKLKIGYVSADFREGPVRYFVEALIREHGEGFETFAYSNSAIEDDITQRMKKYFAHWRDIAAMDDEAVADLIERDAIDILVDLGGHTGNNRLLVFARKPAPVQVSWLGYPATTGIKAMDYRITDVHTEPEGMTEHLNTETLWRLPDIFAAYEADASAPKPGPVPFEKNGFITFGCFNNFTKVNDDVLGAWAEIMRGVPNSRLLLEIRGIDEVAFENDVRARMKKAGLPVDRVTLQARRKENQYVLYNNVDIALDPFPCNGGTTSMDTLWMGVPLVSLAGTHFVSRIGLTILENAGLGELVTQSVDDYVRVAVELANDKQKLKTIRSGLREKVAASPAMDVKKFTKNMEDAYRAMWRDFLQQK